ncbi:putative photosynthetic NDH subunit of lumenal location 3, chloroplastic-like [Cocos nucifera]|uniref:Putative photosynthetic NDH subunit of lumenal location 3, chloroplastic-like n=1 Tax=Cocos nucifera TaxID=13894 RepID=A0A8K0I8J0_COCNU|nr:putative photosynthetic NDH subunit of lumenal location 3, chloroplastic-like [Cocos nucifera]
MGDMIYKGSVLWIKKCAFDFLSLEEDLIDDDDDDSWELMGRDLRLKSTFLCRDLNHVISNSRDEHKKTLTNLGNKLFYFMEEVFGILIRCFSMKAMLLHEVIDAKSSVYLKISCSPLNNTDSNRLELLKEIA